MMTMRLACLAALLLAAACGGIADEPASPMEGDDSGAVESPAPASPATRDDEAAPSPEAHGDGASPEAHGDGASPEAHGDAPSPEYSGDAEPTPSVPAPSDVPVPTAHARPAPAAPAPSAPAGEYEPIGTSPATRDDESPMEGDDAAGWIQGGDVCTADEQCVDGLTCAEVYPYLADGSGTYENIGERRCAYVAP